MIFQTRSKGWNEGYSIFINEDGKFSGDDRREGVYSDLLAMQYEVEKWRRMPPLTLFNTLITVQRKTADLPDFQWSF
jgi:hypothetical protein